MFNLSTPSGFLDAHPTVADGVLVGLSLWVTSIINLVVECPDGKYFGSIRASAQVYDQVLEFLTRSYGRKLREVMAVPLHVTLFLCPTRIDPQGHTRMLVPHHLCNLESWCALY